MRDLSPWAVMLFVVGAFSLLFLTPGPARSQGEDPFLDSNLDGVWVGSVAVKTTEGIRQRPLLLNLDADATSARGAVLGADVMVGEATAISARSLLTGAVRRNKLTFRLAQEAGEGVVHFDFTLRLRRGRLKGKMKSGAEGINGPSKVELVPLDGDSPLQQVWIGELDDSASPGRTARATLPVAIFLRGAGPLTGAGLVGGLAGTIAGGTIDGDDISVTIATPDGDIDLELSTAGAGLAGSATGAVTGAVSLSAGGVARPVKLRKATGADPAAGKSTELTLRGRNLPAGSMVHVDHADVFAAVPVISKPRLATVRILVGKEVPAGTDLPIRLLTPDGKTLDLKKSLRSAAGGGVSFELDLEPIFASSCALSGCHGQPSLDDPAYDDGMAAGDLVLAGAVAWGNIVNTPSSEVPELFRIEPFDPDDSYLIRKLRGVGIQGDRMPQGGPYLTDAQIDMFVQWVNAGAERN